MYRNHAFAKSTAASYKSQLRAYLRFCLFFGYTPVPCRPIHLLRYIVFLARTLSTRSIPNYLNVVRLLHLQYGSPNPLEDPLFKHQKTLLMRGIKSYLLHPMFFTKCNAIYILTPRWTPPFGRHVWSHFSPSFVSQTYCHLPPRNLTPSATCGNTMFDCSRGASFLLFVGLKRSNTEIALSWFQFRRLLTPPCVLCQR